MLKAGATMRAAAMKAALLGVCVMLPCKWAAALRCNRAPLRPLASGPELQRRAEIAAPESVCSARAKSVVRLPGLTWTQTCPRLPSPRFPLCNIAVQAFIQLAPSRTNAGIARPTLSMPLRKVGDGGGIVSLTSLLGLQTLRKRARRLQLHATVLSTETLNKKPAKSSMVFLLITLNMLVFVLDKFSPVYMQGLYLNHRTPQLHQFVSSALCHANAQHLSSNMFPLLVFGKSVEEELGATGLLFCYVSCAVLPIKHATRARARTCTFTRSRAHTHRTCNDSSTACSSPPAPIPRENCLQ